MGWTTGGAVLGTIRGSSSAVAIYSRLLFGTDFYREKELNSLRNDSGAFGGHIRSNGHKQV